MKTIPVAFALLCACVASAAPAPAPTAAQLVEEGRRAFADYDFGEASRLYALAAKKLKRGDAETSDILARSRSQLAEAENFLERVERIAVIDSITVPKEAFFKAYRLPLSSGTLSGPEALPFRTPGTDYVFTNEGGDYKLWAQPDSVGEMRLFESSRLTDGSWSPPARLSDDLTDGGSERYPFMMPDGVTLYYADNGNDSLGGYDIMVATRDPSDGSFLQPRNMGFPYNSPYDDYLLAIDELNGVGWWATDRNRLGDALTVYVFVPNDVRRNYPPDHDDLAAMARIDDIRATWPEDADFSELLATLRSIDPDAKPRLREFTLPAPGGKIYANYDELPAKARSAARRYPNAMRDYDSAAEALGDMRRDWARTRSEALGRRIREAESRLEASRTQLASLRNDLYRLLN